MPLDDLFATLADTGANGKRGMFARTALAGAVVGAGVGGWLGAADGSIALGLGYALLGAFIGWGLGLLLRGFVVFAAVFLALFAVVMGWMWMTGGLG